MKLQTHFFSEKGSLMPLWAIGGMMVMISIFWVENTSFSILDKLRNIHITSAVARTSLIDHGRSQTALNEIVSASGTSPFNYTQKFKYASVEDMEELKDNDRLQEIISARTNTSQTTTVPFETLNDSLHLSKHLNITSLDNTVKVLHPLNIHLAVESTPENKPNMSRVSQPLYNAIKRLTGDAADTRVNIIPYSYRVNNAGRCYTGINRGDDFSFVWWENAFREEDLLTSYKSQLTSAKNNFSSTNSSIVTLDRKLADLKKEQAKYKPGTEEYAELQKQIDSVNNQLTSLTNSLPQLEASIDNAQEKVDKQTKVVEDLQASENYIKFLPLAQHYAKRYQNYRYFEDYTDEVANQGDFSMPEENYSQSASKITLSPTVHYALSVSRNNYFGDTNTCPSTVVSSNMSSPESVKSALNSIDYSGKDLLALEGLLWAGRSFFSGSSSLTRNVVIMFISGKDDSIDPETLAGVQEACTTIKNTFSSGKVSKLVVVAPDADAADNYVALQCATSWNNDTGFIFLDNYVDDFDKEIETRFIHYFSQESTTRNVNG